MKKKKMNNGSAKIVDTQHCAKGNWVVHKKVYFGKTCKQRKNLFQMHSGRKYTVNGYEESTLQTFLVDYYVVSKLKMAEFQRKK